MDLVLKSYNCARNFFTTGYMSDVKFYVGENTLIMNSPLTSYNCARKLFKTGYTSDITFYVGESKTNSTRYAAHKCFMVLASPVFSAMLEGKFLENKTGEILITDVTPLAFNALLRFIYTDEINENITISEYADILYAAKKYMMDPLTNYCLQKLAQRPVNFENFWYYYNIINYYFCEQMPPKMVMKTLNFLSDNSEELLCCDECVNLSSDIVGKIVESKSVKVDSELTVINFILNWSRMECCRQKLDVTFDNRRKVLGDIIYKIRFLTLSTFELKSQSELLSMTEIDDVLMPLLNKKYNDESKDYDNDVRKDNDENNDILCPWNKKLLGVKRDDFDFNTLRLFGVSSTRSYPQCTNYKISIIPRIDFICEFVCLTVSAYCDELVIKTQIKKLNGEILKHFENDFECFDTHADVCVDVPICLKAYTCYILEMEFENGSLSSNKYVHYCSDTEESLFIIEELSNCLQYESKSPEYWENVFKNTQKMKQFDCFLKEIVVHIC